MCEIIDFPTKRGEFWRRKADRCADRLRRCVAEVEWLKWSGAPLVDQVRASLDADRAREEHRQMMERSLALIPAGAGF